LPESFAPGKVTTMTWDELVASNAALSGEVRRSHEALKIAQLTIDKMKVELAYLRRMKYGRSSERLEQPQPQLELVGGQTAPVAGMPSTQAEPGGDDGQKSNVSSLEKERAKRQPKPRPGLREMPEHLPRRTVVHTPLGGCDCQACGAGLREIGQDVSEVLDYEPGTFHVVRHVRPKLACAGCHTITRRWRRAGRWTGAWPAPDCSRTSGEQVRRPHAAVPAVPDLRPRGRRSGRSTITDWVGQAAGC
jgi:transposase